MSRVLVLLVCVGVCTAGMRAQAQPAPRGEKRAAKAAPKKEEPKRADELKRPEVPATSSAPAEPVADPKKAEVGRPTDAAKRAEETRPAEETKRAEDARKPAEGPTRPAEAGKTKGAAKSPELGLDLSSVSVGSVLVLPPVLRIVTSQGSFTGLSTSKTVERFDAAAHKRLVAAFQKELEGKVLPAESAMGALATKNVGPGSLKSSDAIARLASHTNVEWVVTFEFNKTGSLVGTIYDWQGLPAGEPSYVTNAAGISQKHADDMAAFVARQLKELTQKRALPVDEELQEEYVEPELHPAPVVKRSVWIPEPSRSRVAVSVGPGGMARSLQLTGDAAASFAELRNGTIVGLGLYAQVAPLQMLESTAGRAWSDLELEVHYRRAFARARGVAGAVEGQSCAMTDDDLQWRASWRYRLKEGMWPSVGLGAGYSQERTVFSCDFPVVSASYRGADLQLRVRQPLFRDLVALDLSVGPRFLLAGPAASRPGTSFAGEGWVEARPISFLFARAGVRVSRLVLAMDADVGVVDTRTFFALELGAFL